MPLKSEMRQSYAVPFFNMAPKALAGAIREEPEIKEIQIEKEVKQFLFANNILYMRSQKLHQKASKTINNFSKMAE